MNHNVDRGTVNKLIENHFPIMLKPFLQNYSIQSRFYEWLKNEATIKQITELHFALNQEINLEGISCVGISLWISKKITSLNDPEGEDTVNLSHLNTDLEVITNDVFDIYMRSSKNRKTKEDVVKEALLARADEFVQTALVDRVIEPYTSQGMVKNIQVDMIVFKKGPEALLEEMIKNTTPFLTKHIPSIQECTYPKFVKYYEANDHLIKQVAHELF